LANEYGLPKFERALEKLRLSQTFFPQPSEIKTELEAMVANERSEYLKDHPYRPDPNCSHVQAGWARTMDGVERCRCWLLWKGIQPTQDRKTTAAGER
jgi:hypothetical protein